MLGYPPTEAGIFVVRPPGAHPAREVRVLTELLIEHFGSRRRAGTMKIAVVLHPRPGEDVGGRPIAREGVILGTKTAGRSHSVLDHLIAVVAGATSTIVGCMIAASVALAQELCAHELMREKSSPYGRRY